MGDWPVEHIPVLSQALAERIKISGDAVVVDTTVGQGGHSLVLGKKLGPEGILLGLDVDEKCIRAAREKLRNLVCKVVLVRENFAELHTEVKKRGIGKVDFILADLGVCSGQFADPQRGLSFQTDMPLDMRLDSRLKVTATDIVNRTSQRALADLIFKFGQERASRRIARFIVQSREHNPITTTGQLASIVSKALGQTAKRRKSKIHPATRTFQALRIAVNHEPDNMEKLLRAGPALLSKGGRIAVISFHSLEDRLVKNNFRQNAQDGIYKIVTKKPVVAARAEIIENPRARTAKLRISERL